MTSSASKPGQLEDGDLEHLADPADVGKLHREVVVHALPVGLVFGVLLVAEGGAGGSKLIPMWVGLLVLIELAQHGGEAVGGVRGQAAARGQPADGVVRPVELRVAVDEVEGLRAAAACAVSWSYRRIPADAAPPAAVLLMAAGLQGCLSLRVRARVLASGRRLGHRLRHRPPRAMDGVQGARRPWGPRRPVTPEAARALFDEGRARGSGGP